MSTSIENLRRLAQRDVKDHTAIFDLYVTVGRDVDYLSIKFGMDPDDLIHLLEGYGEKIQFSSPDEYDGDDPAIQKSLQEFGVALDYSGKGRLHGLPRILIEEYVERFYPGIASEHPENDWINIVSYLEQMHPGWQAVLEQARLRDGRRADTEDEPSGGSGSGSGLGDEPGANRRGRKKKVRNKFRLFG